MSNDTNGGAFEVYDSSAKSAKFEHVGDSITGTVVKSERVQRLEFGTKKPMTWSDGKPVMQTVITLQTDLRDNEDDGGLRNVYARGSAMASSRSMYAAIGCAIRDATGEEYLEEGATLTVTFVGEESTNRGGFPRKLYTATYKPAVTAAPPF